MPSLTHPCGPQASHRPPHPRPHRPLARLALGLLLAATQAAAAPPEASTSAATASPAPNRPRIGLVLSGGGARGLSHVGVLRALEAARVPVDVVVGTSMGAIVGGLYASGMPVETLEAEVLALDWGGLFEAREPRQRLPQRRKEEDFLFSPVLRLGFRDGEFRLPGGAVSSRGLEAMLRRHTLSTRHLRHFDQLPTPFRAVATDMETGEAVVLDRGDLAAALRASMSVPGVFSPLELDGRILGDGGLVNNLPVDVARELGADVVIAVNIGTPLAGRETLDSVVGLAAQMVNILTEQNVRRSMDLLTSADLLLLPPLGRLSSADFERAAELVRIGHDYGTSVREALRRFALDEADHAAWALSRQQRAGDRDDDTVRVAALRFEGVDPARARHLGHLIDTAPGQAVPVAQIERDLQQLAATGDYERVDYQLSPLDGHGEEALTLVLHDNRWGPNYFRFGLDLHSDFRGQGGFNLRLSHQRRWLDEHGAEWRNQLQIGETLAAFSERIQPLDRWDGGFVAATLDARLRRVEAYDPQGRPWIIGRRRSLRLGLDRGWTLGRQGQLGELRLGVSAGWHHATPDLVSASLAAVVGPLGVQRWREGGLRLALRTDQLDHAHFPSAGHRLRAELMVGRLLDRHAPTRGFTRVEADGTWARSWGPHTLNLGTRLAYASDIPQGALDEYSLGGFQQLSGYRIGQVSGNYLAFGRLSYYQRLPWNPGVVRALFVGGSLETGNAWTDRHTIGLSGLRAGGSLFIGADTGFGPLYLAAVHAPRGYSGLYLLLGRP